MRRVLAIVGCVVASALAGCSSGDDIGRTVPVRGRVTYEGNPLGTGVVIFRPDVHKGNTGGNEARGTIDAEGYYKLSTGTGPKPKEGVPPGWYQVGVVSLKEPAERPKDLRGGMPPPLESFIPQKYSDPATSGLSVEVTENPESGAYDLKLNR